MTPSSTTALKRESPLFLGFRRANGSHVTSVLLAEVAAELDATPAQVSLAWLLHRSPVVVPVPGMKTEAHLAENVAAAHLRLSTDRLATLTSTGSRR